MHSLMISSDSLPRLLVGILLHFLHDQFLIQRAAVHADAHRLAVIARHLADGRKLLVTTLSRADIARINAIFVQRRRAFGIFRQQHMPVVVKIANDRNIAARIEQAFLDLGHRRRRFRHIHGPAHDLRACLGQLHGLANVDLQRPPCRCSSWTAPLPAHRRPRARAQPSRHKFCAADACLRWPQTLQSA